MKYRVRDLKVYWTVEEKRRGEWLPVGDKFADKADAERFVQRLVEDDTWNAGNR